jgi:tRNA(Arg) A34 adenosine deaminase TadA
MNVRECTLYVTLEPCVLWVSAIRMVGLKDVRYVTRDPVVGGLALLEATDFMRRGGGGCERVGPPCRRVRDHRP